MRVLVAVGLGGATGSILRWSLASWLQNRSLAAGWFPLLPVGTFVVNVLGCFGIGFVAAALGDRVSLDPELRAFVAVGLLGGFTTFSTFSWETYELLRAGAFGWATLNAGTSLLAGLLAVALGAGAARLVFASAGVA